MSWAAEALDGRLNELVEAERAEARAFAVKAALLADIARLAAREASRSRVEQFVQLEVAGSVRCSQGAAGTRVAEAERLVEALPRTYDLLRRGELLLAQYRAVRDETANCPVEVVLEVERRLFPAQVECNAIDLRRMTRRLVATVTAEQGAAAEADRLAQARASRRVWSRPDLDAMSVIGALLPAENAAVFNRDLDLLARRVRAADRAAARAGGPPARSLDQVRADVLADLPRIGLSAWAHTGPHPLAPACPAAGRVVVNVLVPMSTALEIDNTSGWITGYGPVPAEHLRYLLPHAALRRVAVDSHTGVPLAADAALLPPTGDPELTRARLLSMITPTTVHWTAETQHDPSTPLARYIDLRDQHCSGPGCSVPAGRTQHDHDTPWPTGPTAPWNLTLKSERCHRAKHHGWHTQRHPDGTTTWTSPLGRTYTRPSPHQPPPPLPDTLTLPPPHRPPTDPDTSADDDDHDDCPFY